MALRQSQGKPIVAQFPFKALHTRYGDYVDEPSLTSGGDRGGLAIKLTSCDRWE